MQYSHRFERVARKLLRSEIVEYYMSIIWLRTIFDISYDFNMI